MVFRTLEKATIYGNVWKKKNFFKNIWETCCGRGNQYATKHEPLTLWGFLKKNLDTSEDKSWFLYHQFLDRETALFLR